MKSLVLAEKPSVAKELARVLGCHNRQKHYFEGPQYVVTWALGHLVTLAEPEEYDPKYKTWRLEDLPMLPEKMDLKVMRETSHQFKAIRQLCKRGDLKELVIATDAGREGELVARWIMELVGWRKPFKRLWISSQTDQAIKEGFRQLKPGKQYDNLYQSAVCRAEADWLIGLNITRALTSKYNAQLSAGRVQTPTLAMLMVREKEIADFRSVPYWTLTIELDGFTAAWRSRDGQQGRFFDRAKAEAMLAKVQRKEAQVVDLKQKEKQEPHPLAFDLTELQREANRRLGFSAKQTSSVLQRLYEQHKLVTYPRTDSRYLTSDMAATLKGRVQSIAVGPYATMARQLLRKPLNIGKRIVNDAKVTDHHAIIPTEQRVQLGALGSDERKLYDIIVKRFLALFYPPSVYDETRLTLQMEGESFTAKGTVLKQAGWKEVYGASSLDEDEDETAAQESEEDTGGQSLPQLKKGQSFNRVSGRLNEKRTQPPARYTEAGLLTLMEKHNLGTPATRADIIEKLLQTDTIERQAQRLVPTGKGRQLIELVAGELRSPELTAKWEQELERIARGKGDKDRFLKAIREQTKEMIQAVKQSQTEYKHHNISNANCPECGKSLIEKKGKQGKFLVCSDRECSYRRAAEPLKINRRCPQCRKKMELHHGKAGKYVQCRPCNVIEMLSDEPGGKAAKRNQKQLINKYSDNVSLGSSLGDALKAAMEKQDH